MRHPLSTSGRLLERGCLSTVGGVDGFVIEHAFVQAVPQDFEPPVAQGAQRGVVGCSGGGLGVVEVPGSWGPGEAAERPLPGGFAGVAVAGQAAGDRGQLGADRAMRDEREQVQVLLQGHQAADRGIGGVVLLLRRAAAPRHQVRVRRQHRGPRVRESLNQQAVPGLRHHPHLSRAGLQLTTAGYQPGHPGRAVADPELLTHPPVGPADRHVAERPGPVRPRSTHTCPHSPMRLTRTAEALRRADGPVLAGRHPRWLPASAGHPRRRRLISVLRRQATEAFPGGSR